MLEFTMSYKLHRPGIHCTCEKLATSLGEKCNNAMSLLKEIEFLLIKNKFQINGKITTYLGHVQLVDLIKAGWEKSYATINILP